MIGSSFQYDADGNMMARPECGTTYLQACDEEDCLAVIIDTATGEAVAFADDADGVRVKRTDAGSSTYYAGGGFELRVRATTTLNSVVGVVQPLNQFPWRSYSFWGTGRVALRETSVTTPSPPRIRAPAAVAVSAAA